MSDAQPPQEGTDAGAPFVPDAGPAAVDQVVQPPKLPSTEVIAAMLRAGTGKANKVAGERAKCNLQLTEWEAKMMAPGVRRYLEARPALAATVLTDGNEYLMAGVAMTWAGGRMYLERHRNIAAELEAEAAAAPAPATGPIPHEFLTAPEQDASPFYGDPADPSDPRD